MSEVGKLKNLQIAKPGLMDVGQTLAEIDDRKGKHVEETVIVQRVRVPRYKIESAISYWKPLYFLATTEGRLLSGIEAYELGDHKRRGSKANKVPYIAMCNLMALEALIRMGDSWPTVEAPEELMFGSEREKDIAEFWKKTFAPTAFQANWAWSIALAVMNGTPGAEEELLDKYREQLPGDEEEQLTVFAERIPDGL